MTRRDFIGARLALAVFLFATTTMAAADGPARLLEDINQRPSSERSSYPFGFQKLGDLMMFVAFTHTNGYEVWKTDGTVAGTQLVKDINPGRVGSISWSRGSGGAPGFLVLGNRVIFPADDGVHGVELWTSDGTTAGTRMIKDILPGSGGSLVNAQYNTSNQTMWLNTMSGGVLYFLANDGVHGFELWRTDGTEAGTWLVKDIQEGPGSAFGSLDFYSLDSATVGPTLFFRAATALNGAELWRTEGTEASTRLVKDINPGTSSSYPSGLTELNGQLVFSAAERDFQSKLWRSNGTPLSTIPIRDTFLSGSNPTHLTKIGSLIYFQSYQWLYRTDGTFDGTVQLHTFEGGYVQFLGDLGGSLLFQAYDGVHGFEPWISDGTPEGTTLVTNIRATNGFMGIQDVLHVGRTAYIMVDDGVHGLELWRTDGTEAGTRLVADLNPGPVGSYLASAIPWKGGVLFATYLGLYTTDPSRDGVTLVKPLLGTVTLAALGDKALFDSNDGVHGVELWSSDGTDAGTGMLDDLNSLLRDESSYSVYLGALRTSAIPKALFSAIDGIGAGLWLTDGTTQGTTLVKRVYGETNPRVESVLNGTLYFLGSDGGFGSQLWRTDGTTEGTRAVTEVDPNNPRVLVDLPAVVQGRLVLSYEDAEHGPELWTSDGTAAGTRLLSDILPGPDGSSPNGFVAAGDRLYFQAYDDDHGQQLWTTDGTGGGTYLVKDFSPTGGYCCGQTIPFQNKLIFFPWDPVHGSEPWITDGTEAGTFLLREFSPGHASGFIREFVEAGGFGYFAQRDETHGFELWRTDGTSAGTTMVKDIRPGPDSSFPSFLGRLGESVLFTVRDPGAPGFEIWKSDGTETGTVKVVGGFENDAFSAVSVGSTILFGDADDAHGDELWRTDGTAEGTVLVQDISPGIDSSHPSSFVTVGSHLLLTADDPTANRELFTGRTAVLAGRADLGLRDLAAEVSAFGLERGLGSSLDAMLNEAGRALAAGKKAAAIQALETFVKHVDVQTPKKMDSTTADELIDFAQDLVRLLEGAFDTAQPTL